MHLFFPSCEPELDQEGEPDPSWYRQEEDTSDLKLAWENLEVAKVIFSRDPAKYPFELAGVLFLPQRTLLSVLSIKLGGRYPMLHHH